MKSRSSFLLVCFIAFAVLGTLFPVASSGEILVYKLAGKRPIVQTGTGLQISFPTGLYLLINTGSRDIVDIPYSTGNGRFFTVNETSPVGSLDIDGGSHGTLTEFTLSTISGSSYATSKTYKGKNSKLKISNSLHFMAPLHLKWENLYLSLYPSGYVTANAAFTLDYDDDLTEKVNDAHQTMSQAADRIRQILIDKGYNEFTGV